MEKTSRILNTTEVARLLDIGPDDVTVLARKGLIKGFKHGKQWRFLLTEINAKSRDFKRKEK